MAKEGGGDLKRYLISVFIAAILAIGVSQVASHETEFAPIERPDRPKLEIALALGQEAVTQNPQLPTKRDLWVQTLDRTDVDNLSRAMQNLSHGLTEQSLKGRQIPIKWTLSASHLIRGDPNGVEILVQRSGDLAVPFTIQLLADSNSLPPGIHSNTDWSQIHFASGQREKRIKIKALHTDDPRPLDILRLNITVPKFIISDVNQISFLITDPRDDFEHESLIFEHSSPELSAKKFPVKLPVTYIGEQNEQSLVVGFKTPEDIYQRQIIFHKKRGKHAWIAYLDQSNLYMGASKLAQSEVKQLMPWRNWFLSAPLQPNQSYLIALSLDQNNQLGGWINGVMLESLTHETLQFKPFIQISLGGSKQRVLFHDGESSPQSFNYLGEIKYISIFGQALERDTIELISRTIMHDLGIYDKPILRMKSMNTPREGRDTTIDVELSLSHSLNHKVELALNYGGVAQLGYDYYGPPTLIIPPFNTRQVLQLTLVDDKIIENDEVLLLGFQENELVTFDQPFVKIIIEDNDGLEIRANISIWVSAESDGLRHTVNPGVPITDKRDQMARVHNSPFFGNSLRFSGNEMLTFGNHPKINSDEPYAGKSLALAFRTGTDTSSPQMLFHQGNEHRGMHLLIKNNHIEFTVVNHMPDDSSAQSWGPVSVKKPIDELSTIYIVAVFDSEKKALLLNINGNETKSTQNLQSGLFTHYGSATLGNNPRRTRMQSGDILQPGAYLKGDLAEVILFNRALIPEEIAKILDYWQRKY